MDDQDIGDEATAEWRAQYAYNSDLRLYPAGWYRYAELKAEDRLCVSTALLKRAATVMLEADEALQSALKTYPDESQLSEAEREYRKAERVLGASHLKAFHDEWAELFEVVKKLSQRHWGLKG